MNRFVLPFVAMAFATPVTAQNINSATSDWEGFYAGVQIESLRNSTLFFADTPFIDGEFSSTHLMGIHIGYRRQFDAFVVGGELDFVGGNPELMLSFLGTPLELEEENVNFGSTRLGAEVGYSIGRFLPYGTLGVSRMSFLNTLNGSNNASFGTFAGVGLDYQTGEYVSVGVELLRHSYSNFDESEDLEVDFTTIGLNLAVRF